VELVEQRFGLGRRLPWTAAVMSDADACEMAQPEPWKPIPDHVAVEPHNTA